MQGSLGAKHSEISRGDFDEPKDSAEGQQASFSALPPVHEEICRSRYLRSEFLVFSIPQDVEGTDVQFEDGCSLWISTSY